MVSIRFLLDTNVVSDAALPKAPLSLVRRMRIHSGELAIAATTWNESLSGLFMMPRGKRREEINSYLFDGVASSMPILPYDEKAAQWHARERARLKLKGYKPPFADGQIAAVAKVNGLTLVTNNVADFERFDGLEIENWRE